MLRFYSSFLGNMHYPYQICAYYNAKEIRKNTTILIVDSGFGKRPVGVSELAGIQRKFADISVSPDIFKDMAQTLDRTEKWIPLVRDMEKIIVIQGTSVDGYLECYEHLKSFDDFDYFGIGGLIGRDDNELMRIIKTVSQAIKKDKKKIHVFGIGCSSAEMLRFLIENHIDSFDSSSTIRNSIDGQLMTMNDDSLDKITIGTIPSFMVRMFADMNNAILNYKIKYYHDLVFNPKTQKKLTHFGNGNIEVMT